MQRTTANGRHQPLALCLALVAGLGIGSAATLALRQALADPLCKAGDLNGDGAVNIADPIQLLRFLFIGDAQIVTCLPEARPASMAFVVRHAEKESGDDPDLTAEGKLRAQRLAQVFRNVDASTLRLFASDYLRTRATLQPTADLKQVEIVQVPTKNIDNTAAAKDTAGRVLALPPGSVSLICGHSFTILPVLRELGVSDTAGIDINTLYDHLLAVVMPAGQAPQLIRLTY
jgi:phosphohistidine phosphatase SixA